MSYSRKDLIKTAKPPASIRRGRSQRRQIDELPSKGKLVGSKQGLTLLCLQNTIYSKHATSEINKPHYQNPKVENLLTINQRKGEKLKGLTAGNILRLEVKDKEQTPYANDNASRVKDFTDGFIKNVTSDNKTLPLGEISSLLNLISWSIANARGNKLIVRPAFTPHPPDAKYLYIYLFVYFNFRKETQFIGKQL